MRRTMVTSSDMQSPGGLLGFNWVAKISTPPAINYTMPRILLFPVAISVEFLPTEAIPELSATGLCYISPREDTVGPPPPHCQSRAAVPTTNARVRNKKPNQKYIFGHIRYP